MKFASKTVFCRGVVGLLVLSFVVAAASPAFAQPRPPYGRPPGPPGPPPPHHHHRGPSDFEKALGVVGAVGAVAAIANGYSPYGYNRYSRPVVVVEPQPTTVIVEKRSPVVVEKVIEKPVYIDREVIVEKPAEPLPTDYYSPKLGATFKIQNMRIPGYEFTAARLTSNPVEGSPLSALGLVKGDVVTRLDNDPADSLDVLERHEKNTLVRYIKTGTTKVRLGKVYIPTDTELGGTDDDGYYAP